MRRQTIALLAWTVLAIGYASDPEPVPNRTLACQATVSPLTVACFVEQPILVLGDFELAAGIDARASDDSYVTGYLLAGWYAPTWSAWAEIAIPEWTPAIGRSPPLRVGFTARF